MWWLPVIGWALVLTAVFIFAWLSIAKYRYYDDVEKAEILGQKIPDKPWYVEISEIIASRLRR